jgi:hypothetical protein
MPVAITCCVLVAPACYMQITVKGGARAAAATWNLLYNSDVSKLCCAVAEDSLKQVGGDAAAALSQLEKQPALPQPAGPVLGPPGTDALAGATVALPVPPPPPLPKLVGLHAALPCGMIRDANVPVGSVEVHRRGPAWKSLAAAVMVLCAGGSGGAAQPADRVL